MAKRRNPVDYTWESKKEALRKGLDKKIEAGFQPLGGHKAFSDAETVGNGALMRVDHLPHDPDGEE